MIGEILSKFVAKPLAASKTFSKAATIAFASVCESLLLAFRSGFAKDFTDIKEALKGSLIAKTQSEQAEAQKRLAEAATATNQITPKLHAEHCARLETERLALENRRKAAEAAEIEARVDSAKTEAALVKMRAYIEIKAAFGKSRTDSFAAKEEEFIAALRQLQSEGGMLYINEGDLKKLLGQLPKQPDQDNE